MKILLVENDADDRNLFIEAIAILDERLVVDAVSNGFEALKYLSGHDESESLPQAIFIDVSIPYMNALKLVQTIRARHSFDHIAVIILTTLKSYKQSLMYRHLGSPYVVKPYGVTDFAKAIAETLENLPELKIKFTGP